VGRRLSEGLGGAGGRGWGKRDACLVVTGLAAEEMQRGSARPTVRGQEEEPSERRIAAEGAQAAVLKRDELQLRERRAPVKWWGSMLNCCMRAERAVWLTTNVRANRTAAAGWLGPGCENVPFTAGRAKTARRSGSGGSARGYAAPSAAGKVEGSW